MTEKHLAPLWSGTNGHPSDFYLACRTSSYIERISTKNITALILGDEPLRTLAAHSDDHSLIIRWRWATSEKSALEKIQYIHFPDTYEEQTDINFPVGNLVIFDSVTQYSEDESISLKTQPGKNTIQTFTYSPDSETSLLIHKISKLPQRSN